MRRPWIFGLALAASMAGSALPGHGQEPVLVRDIATYSPYSPGSGATAPVRFRGESYFRADDGFLGHELWATDGTLRGTRLVADLCPGRCSGAPQVLTSSGGLLYFVASNTTGGSDSFWLWRSNGTPTGTFPLADLEIIGFGSAGPLSFLAPFQGGVVFLVHDRVRRAWSLWGSDGTPGGTREIAPLPGRFNGAQAPTNFDRPVPQDGRHYFTWRNRLWATDGTAAGTGPVSTPLRPCGAWTRLGRLVFYGGEEVPFDCEPWVSDGTPRGTRRLRDIRPGDSGSYPTSFVAAGGLVYFTATDDRNRQQLWKTNGTPRGTSIVRALATRGLGKVVILGTAGSRVYFAADDGEHGVELWRTDGSAASTALVADLSPGAADTYFNDTAQSFGDRLVFAASPSGAEFTGLFGTQGTAGSTIRLTDVAVEQIYPPSGGQVYFTTSYLEGEEQELGVTDGTVAGTRLLDLNRPVASSNPHRLIAGPGGLAFLAAAADVGNDLWRSGGHPEDTEPFADLVQGSGAIDGVLLVPGSGGAFYFTYDEQRFGWTDGQTADDLLPPRSLAFPQGFTELDGRTIFLAPRTVSEDTWQPWVWSSDGTLDGTAPVAAAAGFTGAYYDFVRSRAARVPETGDVRYLVQKVTSSPENLSGLSATDGSAAGTRELARIPAGRFDTLDTLVAVGPYVLTTFRNDNRSSLWSSDGTAEGTREVYAIQRPYDLSFISGLTAAGDQAFFLGDDFEQGRELWASDGTPEGTRRVADLAPGAASSAPTDIATFGDRVLFSADDGVHGRELWVSDGTETGTHLLEIQPGRRGSYPQAFQVLGDQVVFAAEDGVHGLELWVTDGTPEGTHLAADITAGPRSSSPRDFAVYNGELFFNAGRPQEGYELWKLPLAAIEP